MVTGVVEGGNAAAAGLLPGDSIVGALAAGYRAKTECLNYDRTVGALGGLPPAPAPVLITVKRLVKVPGNYEDLKRFAVDPEMSADWYVQRAASPFPQHQPVKKHG